MSEELVKRMEHAASQMQDAANRIEHIHQTFMYSFNSLSDNIGDLGRQMESDVKYKGADIPEWLTDAAFSISQMSWHHETFDERQRMEAHWKKMEERRKETNGNQPK